MGACAVLVKPFSPEALERAVGAARGGLPDSFPAS
jgi:hypothetical protein